MESIKTHYDGIELEYLDDKWVFELRGRERKADTLTKAKEIIDKPEPKDNKPFERINGFIKRAYSDGVFLPVQVTSIAQSQNHRGEPEVWVMKDGQRCKENAHSIILHTAENIAVMEQIKNLSIAIQSAHKKINDLSSNFTRLSIEDK